jgi:hypothetical protein
MNKKFLVLLIAGSVAALILGLWACASTSSSSSSSAVDDDTSPADDDASPPDDDTSPADDDVSPTDDDDDDNDDASPADDDDDGSPGTTWTDDSTHLMWQVGYSALRDWESALSLCTDLSLGGFGDWRLPTIDELRTIVAGCAATETGGACPVTDACSAPTCSNASCQGCTSFQGPGTNGCYWPTELAGDCNAAFWSDTIDASNATYWWALQFAYAGVVIRIQTEANLNVRCVRSAS